jgi:hypothetical protein
MCLALLGLGLLACGQAPLLPKQANEQHADQTPKPQSSIATANASVSATAAKLNQYEVVNTTSPSPARQDARENPTLNPQQDGITSPSKRLEIGKKWPSDVKHVLDQLITYTKRNARLPTTAAQIEQDLGITQLRLMDLSNLDSDLQTKFRNPYNLESHIFAYAPDWLSALDHNLKLPNKRSHEVSAFQKIKSSDRQKDFFYLFRIVINKSVVCIDPYDFAAYTDALVMDAPDFNRRISKIEEKRNPLPVPGRFSQHMYGSYLLSTGKDGLRQIGVHVEPVKELYKTGTTENLCIRDFDLFFDTKY